MTAIITDVEYRMSPSVIRDLGGMNIDIVACCWSDSRRAAIGFKSKYARLLRRLAGRRLYERAIRAVRQNI